MATARPPGPRFCTRLVSRAVKNQMGPRFSSLPLRSLALSLSVSLATAGLALGQVLHPLVEQFPLGVLLRQVLKLVLQVVEGLLQVVVVSLVGAVGGLLEGPLQALELLVVGGGFRQASA